MTDDEKLTGFLDRELDRVTQADVETWAAREALTATRLSQLRANDDLVRAAFDTPMHEGVPDRFAAVIDAGLASAAQTPARHAPHGSPGNDNQPRWWQFGGAVAASLAIGLVLGTQFMPDASDATTSTALSAALTATPSLQTVTLASGERVTPQLTVAQTGGGYCRQFRLATAAREQAGIACRTSGQWAVEALLPTTSPGAARDAYVTAEGAEPSEIGGVIETRRAGDPLDAAAEQALIARGWR